jgi:opacity protein-like surface antigen
MQVDASQISGIAIALCTLMKNLFAVCTLAALAFGLPATASAQGGQIQGFGGVTLRGFTQSTTFGGSVAVPVTDNIQIVAEGGRIGDLTTAPLAELIALSPIDVRVSAYYGEGGVRFIGSSDRALRPYVEATAGMARLHTGVGGFDGGTLVNAALGFLDSTQPIYGLGGGVVLQGGPLIVDLGYRYHKIGNGNIVQTALTGGRLDSQQLRLGIGVRF